MTRKPRQMTMYESSGARYSQMVFASPSDDDENNDYDNHDRNDG